MSHKLNAVLQIQAPREIKFWNIYSRHGQNFIEAMAILNGLFQTS